MWLFIVISPKMEPTTLTKRTQDFETCVPLRMRHRTRFLWVKEFSNKGNHTKLFHIMHYFLIMQLLCLNIRLYYIYFLVLPTHTTCIRNHTTLKAVLLSIYHDDGNE